MSKERGEMNMFFRTIDIMKRSDSEELGDPNNRWYVYVLRRDGSQFISAISMVYDGVNLGLMTPSVTGAFMCNSPPANIDSYAYWLGQLEKDLEKDGKL